MTTTVSQLRELLEGLDDDAEVRLMNQASWPFEYSVLGTWTPSPQPDACRECGLTATAHIGMDEDSEHAFEPYNDFTPEEAPEAGVVYLVEGTQLAYGTKVAWDEVERAQ